jgi:hypothetical protein
MKTTRKNLLPDQTVLSKIYIIRGQKVMIDQDLAELYKVETKILNQSVKRNIERFPSDFMFELTAAEYGNLKSQFVTSSWGGRRKLPFAFTEQGVAMLSSVLKSQKAIKVNIQIIRVFTRMRQLILSNKEILLKLEQLEKQSTKQNSDIKIIFSALKQLLTPPPLPRTKIGYKRSNEK